MTERKQWRQATSAEWAASQAQSKLREQQRDAKISAAITEDDMRRWTSKQQSIQTLRRRGELLRKITQDRGGNEEDIQEMVANHGRAGKYFFSCHRLLAF